MAREFSTSLAAKVTDASVRRLDTWARSGLLPPSGRPASGKGSRRSYTFQDLVSIRTIVDLRARKCPLQQLRAAIAELAARTPELSNSQTLAKLTLLTDGKRVYLLTDEAQAMDVLTRQTVWAVPLGRHIIETTERIQKLPRAWTEQLRIGGMDYHVRVTGEANGQCYFARCRELPGALEQAQTPEEAVERLRASLERVLAFQARQRATGIGGSRRSAH